MSDDSTSKQLIYDRLVNQIDAIISHCEENQKPLEVDPARSQLFDLFVEAEKAGLVQEDADPDLSEHGLCAVLSARWGLQQAAQQSAISQTKLDQTQLTKMRSLWSVMRLWMEWTYAWSRWAEFH
ncbi:hypothetical protein KOR42_09080 [Thalassoglobus neptunius]|uniref:Uncharacterized protein n=1 Tax=Thalassoglobus neptunius TaxID=1938619 RepID=A0A5C5X382_9PLAN|nr:hypothetical protein [Thalassoglobus neptunius]TWT57547.1 hypothetical protein KOR42_09080 [Thalassoglobus neptunius]